jgi:hypothetical protein
MFTFQAVSVGGESDQGLHPKTVTTEIDEGLFVDSYKKLLVAEYLTAFMGLSVILFLSSLWVQFGRRSKEKPTT